VRSRKELRRERLEVVLRESGLADQVRIGATIWTGSVSVEPPSPALDPLLHRLTTARGQLIEISGGLSSGRTALACRLAAETTGRGELVGWVDLPDALDPRSLRRAGTVLRSLLWARPRGVNEAFRCAELMLRTGFALVVLDLHGAPPRKVARLPVPVWARLLRAARGGRAMALLISAERLAGGTPTLGLWTERQKALFEGGLFEGIEAYASIVRDRSGPTGGEHPLRALQRPHGPPSGS
jgi:hypothetical protein